MTAEPAWTPPSQAELRELMRRSRHSLDSRGWRDPAAMLAEIPTDVEPDLYGNGGVVAELEAEVASILGKPAAVYVPSGTMAQQIVLRVHADRRNRRTVLFHPDCHLAVHELGALERLHGLHGRAVGSRTRTIGIDDLRPAPGDPAPVAEAPAALLLELPQRDLGGQLPAWAELVEQVEWAR